jgi:hypothetical protein
MIKITTRAKEKSTIFVVIDFSDEDGNAVPPKTLSWSLVNEAGTAINGRDRVPIASPSASNTVVLKGDDLQILTSEADKSAVERFVVVEATYDSDLGSDLPANEVATFTLENLYKVT